MPTIFTFHPGKAEMQIAAVQISINHFFHIRTPKPISIHVAVIPQLFKLLEMRFNTTEIMAYLWIPGFIDIKFNTFRALIEHLILIFGVKLREPVYPTIYKCKYQCKVNVYNNFYILQGL